MASRLRRRLAAARSVSDTTCYQPEPPPPPPPPPDEPPPEEPLSESLLLEPGGVEAEATVSVSPEPSRLASAAGSRKTSRLPSYQDAALAPTAAAARTSAKRVAQAFSTS